MKDYLCVKDFYIEDVKFAGVGDIVTLLSDNETVINLSGQRACGMSQIINEENFTPILRPISNNKEEDKVNHPSHYTWLKEKCGIEVIDIIRHLDFDTGNAVKYLLRAGHKEEANYTSAQKEIEDLRKAIFYINDKIHSIECGIAKKK